MDNVALEKIVNAWIAAYEAGDGTAEKESNWWAIDQETEWSLNPESTPLWEFILMVYTRDISERTLAVLAAGPLEDLLAHGGPSYIDRVEQLAKQDKKFNWLLGGVWRNSMSDEIWERVQAVRDEVW